MKSTLFHVESVMKNRWVYPLFNLLLIAALPLIGLAVLLRWHRRVFSKGGDRWAERWGRLSPDMLARFSGPERWWWVHAVSMGEVKAIEAFLRQITPSTGAKVLLSAVTPEALVWAETHRVADAVIAAPLDLPWIVRRMLRVVRPVLFVSVESEFWPNLLRESKRSGARVALINGRISERSYQSYGRIRPLLDALWETLDLFAVRQPEDAQRFEALGVPAEKIKITGNLKYDLYMERRAQKRASGESPTVVMGSTREGEESKLLPLLERVRAQVPAMRIIWAPRHIERISEIEELLKTNGLSYQRISHMRQNGNGSMQGTPYVLWDSMGDLLDAYREADVAVVGGSFVPKGGQNPIEPAALKLPVLFGPSMDNFQGVAENLVKSGGARRVSVDEFEGHLSTLLKNPHIRQEMGEKAQQAVVAEQGATVRTLTLLKGLLHA
jgi:3-deoxy-D-manno-octulosonic-acid transferase